MPSAILEVFCLLGLNHMAQSSTGRVETNSDHCKPQLNGVLAVSRAFGDKDLKASLSAVPDVR